MKLKFLIIYFMIVASSVGPVYSIQAAHSDSKREFVKNIKEVTLLPDSEQSTKIDNLFNSVREEIKKELSHCVDVVCLEKEFHSKHPFYSVSISPNGKILCGLAQSAIGFFEVNLWNINEQEKSTTHNIVGTKDFVRPIFTLDNHHLLWDAGKKGLDDWNLQTQRLGSISLEGKEEVKNNSQTTHNNIAKRVIGLANFTLKDLQHVSFSNDGKYFADCTLGKSSKDRNINVWSVETGKKINTFHIYREQDLSNFVLIAGTFSLSNDGSLLAYASADGMTVWNVRTGEKRIHFEQGTFEVLFSADGKTLAFQSTDKLIRVLNIETGKIIKKITNTDEICSILFSHDGKGLVLGLKDDEIKFVSTETEDKNISFQTKHKPFVQKWKDRYKDDLKEIAISSDGKHLATCSESKIKLWNIDKIYSVNKALDDSYTKLTSAQKMFLYIMYNKSHKGRLSYFNLATLSQKFSKQYGDHHILNLMESYNSFDPVLKEIIQAKFNIVERDNNNSCVVS